MKVQIHIIGQMAGNFLLAKKINASWKSTGFGNMKAIFDSKGQAKEALKNAYQSLIDDEPEFKNKIILSPSKRKLTYDSSIAEIL
jgi:hypothetical protein